MRPRVVKPAPARVVLFADVDGTLLDARDGLAISPRQVAALRDCVEIVLASSRTLVELAPIQRRLGLVAPLVAENGAVISLPPRWRGRRAATRRVMALGRPASRLRPLVRQCAERAGVSIVDQRDTLPGRGQAVRRTHSVCIRRRRSAGAGRFVRALLDSGLEATVSGTWITITGGANKGSAAKAVVALARQQGVPYRATAAVGNAENDAPLLAAADGRYAIRNPRTGHDPALLDIPGVHRLGSSGTRAWRELLALLSLSGGGC